MRPLLVTALLLAMAFAGCLDGDDVNDDDPASGTEDPTNDDGNLTVKPEKRFEPKIVFQTPDFTLQKGGVAEFTYYITDLHDYEYPTSFIDWNLTYEKEPNPVDEGEADDLPSSYSRTLFSVGPHNFTFNYNDGQGFAGNRTISVEVVNPVASEAGLSYLEGVAPLQVETYFLDACVQCDGNSNLPERPGSAAGVADVSVYLFDVPSEYAGAPFQLLSTGYEPRAEFFDACDGERVGSIVLGDAGIANGVVPAGATCVAVWEGLRGSIGPLGPYSQGVQGGKFTLALNAEAVFDDEGLCWTGDFVLIGHNQAGQGLYQTDGSWVYAEGNGVPGIQWDPGHVAGCAGGDILIF